MKIIVDKNYYYLVKTDLLKDEICYFLDINDIVIPEKEYLEIGPLKNIDSAFSTNVLTIFKKFNINNITSFEKVKLIDKSSNYEIDELIEENYNINNEKIIINYPKEFNLHDDNLNKNLKIWGIHFDNDELLYYKKIFNSLNRNPTFTELFDICQSNSEHSRHWFFKGSLSKYGITLPYSLFDIIKKTNNKNSNSLVAFNDNSSVIKGYKVFTLNTNINNESILIKEKKIDLLFNAETHNFPTLVYPFEGAATGIGGRIRDTHATGRGSSLIAGTAGYAVGSLNNPGVGNYPSPKKILIEASNGASDYGNKIGEPIINGFTRSFGMDLAGERIEYVKPILFTGGIGYINHKHIMKNEVKENMIVLRIGGPAYKIGFGGGFASSVEQGGNFKQFEKSAVQRGDPQYANKLNRVITNLIEMNEDNPIISIHDQGAGGLANVVKEIVYPIGAIINLENVTVGDKNLQPVEIWCSEFQESDVLVIHKDNFNIVKDICIKEGVILDVIGEIFNTKKITVKYYNEIILDLPLKEILEPPFKKKYKLIKQSLYKHIIPDAYTNNIPKLLEIIFKSLDVCSKRFLTNKVDRSVTGLIAQQQCVGPFHTPVSNYALTSISYFVNKGIATSIGEKPILGLLSSEAQGNMSVGEMITNMMGVCIENIESIKCSGNWMWNIKREGEYSALYDTAQEMCKTMNKLGIALDGGKDSLSMSVNNNDKVISSPGTLVISGYAPCPDINIKVTPLLQKTNTSIILLHFEKYRMGGSCLYKELNSLGFEPPKLDNPSELKTMFNFVQLNIKEGNILALHDRSDGGLITTLMEMAITSNIGLTITLPTFDYKDSVNFLFNEELGVVIEIENSKLLNFEKICKKEKIKYNYLGTTNTDKKCIIYDQEEDILLNLNLSIIRNYWEFTSYELDKLQTKISCVNQEYNFYTSKNIDNYYLLNEYVNNFCNNSFFITINEPIQYKIAIIREEGSNGDKEMQAAFYYVGFEVYNITTSELIKKPYILEKFKGIVFVGGFSYSDVLGAAKGWELSITKNDNLYIALKSYFENPNKFSLGVCNGCQLMIRLNLFTNNIKLVENNSERFESRFTTVKIPESNSIFFKNMKNSTFGIWVAHKEGKFINCSKLNNKQIAMVYNYNDISAISYPFNPNGSERSIAGISSSNGRHLALMPHPERCFMKWQLPYLDKYKKIENSPWLLMFKNAFDWCKKNN
jgi:phosphoribosylformylglycinamidine synthase